jgi:hypothetical protein
MSVLKISQKANKELHRYDNILNMDGFNASEKLNDLWNDVHSDLCCDFDLPSVYLWEDGFCKGDASDDEIDDLIKKFEVEDEEELFNYLDSEFEDRISDKLDVLIEEYDDYFRKEKDLKDEEESDNYER